MQPLTLLGAEVVATVAMLQSERDTLRDLLRQVLRHAHLPSPYPTVLALLPRELTEEIREVVE